MQSMTLTLAAPPSMVSLVLLVLAGWVAAALELADFGPVEAFHGMDGGFGVTGQLMAQLSLEKVVCAFHATFHNDIRAGFTKSCSSL